MKISWSYITGFFDGDGCIHFKNRENKDNYKHRTMMVYLDQAKFQGQVLYEISTFLKKENIEHRIVFNGKSGKYLRLVISSLTNCEYFLKKVLPYTIVKKEKVINAIKYIGEKNHKNLKFTNKEKEKIIVWYKKGFTQRKIASLWGKSGRGRINKIIQEYKNENKEILAV